MAESDKKSVKPAPNNKEQKVDAKEIDQELDEEKLDQVNGGVDGRPAWTASGVRKR